MYRIHIRFLYNYCFAFDWNSKKFFAHFHQRYFPLIPISYKICTRNTSLTSRRILYNCDNVVLWFQKNSNQHNEITAKGRHNSEPDKVRDPKEQSQFQSSTVGREDYRDEDHNGCILEQISSHCIVDPTSSLPAQYILTQYNSNTLYSDMLNSKHSFQQI